MTRFALLAAINARNVSEFISILATEGLPPFPHDHRLLIKTLFRNQPTMSQLLINFGCHVNDAKYYGNSALHLAIHKNSSYELIKSLVLHGAVVNQIDSRGNTALHLAFINNVEGKIVDLLLQTHFKRNFRNEINESGMTYLHIAASRPNLGYIEYLIEHDEIDINCRIHVDADSPYAGYTPLHMAVEFGRLDIAELLLNYGANLYMKNVDGSTPLHLALERRDEDFIELLFEYDYKRVNHINRYGLSHFMAACACRKSSVVSNFLDDLANGHTNLDINEVVNNSSNYPFKGYTAMHVAVEYGHLDTVRILLANGVRLTPTYQGHDLRHVARKKEFYDIARLIQMHERQYQVVDDDDDENDSDSLNVLMNVLCNSCHIYD